MTFLSEYDAIAADQPQLRIAHIVKHLRGDWRGMYEDLRAKRAVFETPVFTMVTRATDVLDVLSQPQLFSVRANSVSMDPSVGPFMLARDETAINWHEKGLMQAVLRWDDIPKVRALAGDVTAAALRGEEGEADLVPAVGRRVPLKIVQDYFGFAASDEKVLAWSFATQHAMFRNLTNDPEVIRRCVEAGREMRAWLWPFLAEKWAAAPLDDSDVVSRIINLSRTPAAAFDPERVVSNVCGLLVGTIETMSQAIVQVVDQLLADPTRLAQAREAARAEDSTHFDAIVFEALRFNPITTIQFRVAEADREIGTGTPYAHSVKAGTLIAACTGSAMFDPDLMPGPEDFRTDRPASSYLHLGFGHHVCLGKHLGLVAIPEAVRQAVLKPDLRRKAGAGGHIDFAGGPFPEHFQVEWGGTSC